MLHAVPCVLALFSAFLCLQPPFTYNLPLYQLKHTDSIAGDRISACYLQSQQLALQVDVYLWFRQVTTKLTTMKF
jgi:hypothetical protein